MTRGGTGDGQRLMQGRPYLTARELAAALRPAPQEEVLTRPWRRAGDRAVFGARSSWWMAAIGAAATRLRGRTAQVWLPEYFCDMALWPLRQQDVALSFYPVDEALEPDWPALEAMSAPCDVFVLTHTQGYPNPAGPARAFCDARGAILLEDAANVLRPEPGVGELGDLIVYSPWKFLSIPNGAVLVVAARAAELEGPVRAAAQGFGAARALGLAWVRKSLLGAAPALEAAKPQGFFSDPPTMPLACRMSATPIAAPLLAHADLDAIAARRRALDTAISSRLLAQDGVSRVFRQASQAPLRVAFKCRDEAMAASLWAALRGAGIEAEGWPGLPPEAPREGLAWRLRRQIVYLPCHQGLSVEAVETALAAAGF